MDPSLIMAVADELGSRVHQALAYIENTAGYSDELGRVEDILRGLSVYPDEDDLDELEHTGKHEMDAQLEEEAMKRWAETYPQDATALAAMAAAIAKGEPPF